MLPQPDFGRRHPGYEFPGALQLRVHAGGYARHSRFFSAPLPEERVGDLPLSLGRGRDPRTS